MDDTSLELGPLRSFLSRFPAVYMAASHAVKNLHSLAGQNAAAFWLYSLTQPGFLAGRPSEKTDLVIEGYGASANTFASIAFDTAQGNGAPTVAHHSHAPSEVRRAARHGVPVLLLIRDPDEAIPAAVARFHLYCPAPVRCLELELTRYIRFYRGVLPRQHEVVIGDFARVVGDFGSVIAEINDRFGTEFLPFEHTEQNVERVMQRIGYSKPNALRETRKATLKELLKDDTALARRMSEAQLLYSSFSKG